MAAPARTTFRAAHRHPARAAAFHRCRTGRARRADARRTRVGAHRRQAQRRGFLPQGSPADLSRAFGLSEKNMPCDAVTLGEWFDANGLAELVGGAAISCELANSTPSAANIVAYADIVREKSMLRQLIDAGTEITGDGFQPEGRSTQEMLESAEQKVFRIAESGARGRKDFVADARSGEGSVSDPASALRKQGLGHRTCDRLHRSRRTDGRPAAVRSDHRRGASIDGQDRARGELRRTRGDADRRRRSRSFRWKCRPRSSRSV